MTASHETVKVSPSDHGGFSTHGNGCNYIGARHDSGVDHYLYISAYLFIYFRKEVEGDRGSIKLATSVV
jgi:hypothetical protein